MKKKPLHRVCITVSEEAAAKIPSSRAQRDAFINHAARAYAANPPAKTGGKINRYEKESVWFTPEDGVLADLSAVDPKAPVCSLLNDAIIRA